MKTFFAFTTGLLGGIFVGFLWVEWMADDNGKLEQLMDACCNNN